VDGNGAVLMVPAGRDKLEKSIFKTGIRKSEGEARGQKRQTSQSALVGKISGTLVMILVRFVRSDREMKAGPGKVIFKVSIRILVIVSLRSGLEKLSGEQAGIAKAEVESFIHLVFGDQIEFVADVAAGAGAGGNRNRSAAGVEIVV